MKLLLVNVLVCSLASLSVFLYHYNTSPKVATLDGAVDDCNCLVESVDDKTVFSILESLVTKTFYKYFKVDYDSDCPFWYEEKLCTSPEGGCGICPCDENEVPPALRTKKKDQDCSVDPADLECSSAQDSGFSVWEEENEDVWITQGKKGECYINLEENPERFTGYSGSSAARVWSAIYRENCFSGENSDCFEERVFYRLISGFHSSTTAHITYYYQGSNGDWEPNVGWFISGLGSWPSRMVNIYFTYVFLLRAVNKAAEEISLFPIDTGNPEEDVATQELTKQLILYADGIEKHRGTFNETKMFAGEMASLKYEFKSKFRNISEIMDCVACESCKVHAKLQILGIGTGLKILLSDKESWNLQHNEIIALVNTLHKFSDSIRIIHEMRQKALDAIYEKVSHSSTRVCGVLSVLICVVSFFIRQKKGTQEEEEKKKKANEKKKEE